MNIGGFINVLDDSGDHSSDPTSFRSAGGLTERLRVLASELGDRGLSWTLYLSRDATLTESVDLPENLEVVVAPRVVIRVSRGMKWIIRGLTDLGYERRFELAEGALVRLLGPLDEVPPIWWRSAGDQPDDAAAIEAAIGVVLDRAVEGLSQAILGLYQTYVVGRTVRIAPSPTAPGDGVELIIQGCHPVGDLSAAGSIRRRSSTRAPGPLVEVIGPVRLILRDVGLIDELDAPDASGLDHPILGVLGDIHGLSLTRCTFVSARSGFIQLRNLADLDQSWYGSANERLDDLREAQEIVERLRLTRSSPAVVKIQWCRFVHVSHTSYTLRVFGGIRVLRGRPVHLCVQSCDIESATEEALLVGCGVVQVEDCTFSAPESALAPHPSGIRRIDEYPIEHIFPVQTHEATKPEPRSQRTLIPSFDLAPAVDQWTTLRPGLVEDKSWPLPPTGADPSKRSLVSFSGSYAVSVDSDVPQTSPWYELIGPTRVVMVQVALRRTGAIRVSTRMQSPGLLQATLTNVLELEDGPTSVILWHATLGQGSLVLQGCTFLGSVAFIGADVARTVIDVATRFSNSVGFQDPSTVQSLATQQSEA